MVWFGYFMMLKLSVGFVRRYSANVNEVLVCIFLSALTLFADVALLLPLHVYLFIFI